VGPYVHARNELVENEERYDIIMLLANIQYIPESIFVRHFRHYDEHFIPYKRL